MAVPDYQTLMLPLLQSVADGQARTAAEVRGSIAERLGLDETDLQVTLSSGQPVFHNRVGWASTYLVRAGLLRRPKRGVYEITERGQEVLESEPDRIDNRLLEQYEEFREFLARSRAGSRSDSTSEAGASPSGAEAASPQERLSEAVEEVNIAVAAELVDRIRSREPAFLEVVVLKVLTSLGYGGREGSAEQLGGPHDQGLDGVIRQDALGLDRIYVQAKRYGAGQTVDRPEIQRFIGALQGAQADRGVFITTSRFSQGAQQYADQVSARVVLIDGEELGRLMVKHNVGAETEETYSLKRVDEDFFEIQ